MRRNKRSRGEKMFWRALSAALLCCLLFTNIALAKVLLKKGSSGPKVVTVQEELQNAGYQVSVDGIFGNETYRALLDFQRAHQLKVSGKVDDKTWTELQKYQKGRQGSSNGLQSRRVLVKESAPFVPQSDVDHLLTVAKKYMGVRYVFGGTSPKGGFDCSGYVQYVFRECGYSIPRTADVQFEIGKKTTSSRELVPGDLVFFTTYEPGASHVGIYLGSTKFIHASSSRGVMISSLNDEYFKQRYYGGKKVVITDGAATAEPALSEKELKKKRKAEEKARRAAEEKARQEAEEKAQREAEAAAQKKAEEERAAAERSQAEAKRKAEASQAQETKAPVQQPGKAPSPMDAPKQSNLGKSAAPAESKPTGTQATKPAPRPQENNPSPMGQHKSR